MKGQRPDHNYQDYLPDVQHVRQVAQPVRIGDVEHVPVYRTAQGPKWSCWTRAWLTSEGHVRVSFFDMSGGPSDRDPSYSWEYASREALAEAGIKRCSRWCESRDAGRTWQPVHEIDASDRSQPWRDFYLSLSDGTLLSVGGLSATWDTEKQDYHNIGHAIAWASSDGGQSWSGGVSLNDPEECMSVPCRPRQLQDGTVVLPAYGHLNRKNATPVSLSAYGFEQYSTDAWLWFSRDNGRTWSEPLVLAHGLPDRTNAFGDLVTG